MLFALTSAEVHWCCLTAHLYGEQVSTAVIEVTQACCEPFVQSNTEQWQLHFALTSAAVHFCCITAHLYAEQIFTDVAAVTQTCCEPVLQSNTDQGGNALCLDQCCTAFLLAHCTPA